MNTHAQNKRTQVFTRFEKLEAFARCLSFQVDECKKRGEAPNFFIGHNKQLTRFLFSANKMQLLSFPRLDVSCAKLRETDIIMLIRNLTNFEEFNFSRNGEMTDSIQIELYNKLPSFSRLKLLKTNDITAEKSLLYVVAGAILCPSMQELTVHIIPKNGEHIRMHSCQDAVNHGHLAVVKCNLQISTGLYPRQTTRMFVKKTETEWQCVRLKSFVESLVDRRTDCDNLLPASATANIHQTSTRIANMHQNASTTIANLKSKRLMSYVFNCGECAKCKKCDQILYSNTQYFSSLQKKGDSNNISNSISTIAQYHPFMPIYK